MYYVYTFDDDNNRWIDSEEGPFDTPVKVMTFVRAEVGMGWAMVKQAEFDTLDKVCECLNGICDEDLISVRPTDERAVIDRKFAVRYITRMGREY